MKEQVLEGTWEEVVLHAAELSGHRVRVTVLADAGVSTEAAEGRPVIPSARAKAFRKWAGSHSRTTPLLSDEAISRENLYGERG